MKKFELFNKKVNIIFEKKNFQFINTSLRRINRSKQKE